MSLFSDTAKTRTTNLRNQVQELAGILPGDNPAAVRIGLVLMEIVRELGRLETQFEALSESVHGGLRFSIAGGNSDDRYSYSGPARDVRPEPSRASAVTDHHAGL